MARESHPVPDATPNRRASTAEPSVFTGRRSIIRTPGSSGRGLQRPQGLSASGRKVAPPTATPHARAAFRTIDSRRAAIFTPHRARRRSVREARDSPRDFLLSLGKVLAKTSEPIETSSSSPGDGSTGYGADDDDDDGPETTLGPMGMDYDDDDEELPKRPRLSLPLDGDDEDDSDDLVPHRSIIMEDENFTMQSIEMPRRAYSEQPGGRLSMNSPRMSDFFNTNDMLHSEDAGQESGFFPPINVMEDENYTMDVDLASPERLDDAGRRDTGHESDFGIHVPLDLDENTFMIAAEVQDSPDRAPADDEEQPGSEDYAPLVDQRSDSDPGDFGDLGDMPDMEEEEPDGGTTNRFDDETQTDITTTKSAGQRSSSKKKGVNISKHGIEYPSLPPAVVKRLAQNFAKTGGAKGKITPDAMAAIMQASEWYFEQLGEDLGAYAKHAGRKTIDESDVLTLMKRQRQINSQTTPFSLAQRYLPRELLQDLRMAPPAPSKKSRKAPSAAAAAEEDDDGT
ncbi:centromere kinetochore component CENP-T-domain-containing protein [Podospora fimiseda]|uniref:Centromere kinetochore component CENP-T-domain-containing protein n=1 Tax=Podospora fimiseda TaxID=252190 RepID=A0AAN7BUV8_9PEZI|nr:centromere kinetochore component CENP-T-domain-containing protein [Podospora fimiseda]